MKRTSWAGGTLRLLFGVVVVAALAGCGSGSDDALSGAGESCTKSGDCEGGLKCVNLVCQQAGADCPGDQNCSGRECGPDLICGVSCGSCDSDETCQNGQCVDRGSNDIYSPPDTYSPPTGGTWKDPTSGSTWQVSPPTDHYTWNEAKSYCDSLSLGGHSDWHLPTIGELRALIRGCPATEAGGSCNIAEDDCLAWSCRDGSCSECESGDGPGEEGMCWPDEVEGDCYWYWSSSPVQDGAHLAWIVHFGSGYVDDAGVSHDMRVRCVR
jgi:hypothetical protein